MSGGERVRLFCALTLDDATRAEIVEWQTSAFDPTAVRIVPFENLHVTLAFLGQRGAEEVAGISRALHEAARGAGQIEFLLPQRKYRETRSVGMLVLRDLHGTARALADDLHARLELQGVYKREQRPWLPHLTVVRFNRRPGLDPGLPDLGRFSPSGAAVYHSVLRPGGARYEVVEKVRLGG